jgi:glycosyltransferase involved in cell wall biosynthesis
MTLSGDPAQARLVRVSVITIAWNDLGGLKRTVESVRAQTWAPIEHIVVDGDSEDGSREWLETLDERTDWVSEPDKGRYDAMNKGIAKASGDLIWFMNSGDWFRDSDTVARVVEEYLHSGFGWAYGLSNIVADGQTRAIGGRIPFELQRFLLGGRVVPHQAAVFSKKIVDQIGDYDITFGLAADQLFIARAALASPPHTIARVLCNFDATGAGSSRGAWHHYRDMSRTREATQVRVSGSRAVDRSLSWMLWAATVVQRKSRGLVNRLSPEVLSK